MINAASLWISRASQSTRRRAELRGPREARAPGQRGRRRGSPGRIARKSPPQATESRELASGDVPTLLDQPAEQDGVPDARSGTVAIIQRFGEALDLNVHALVVDGVFAKDGHTLRFVPGRRLTRDDVAEVVAIIARRIERVVQRRGLVAAPEEGAVPDAQAEEAPVPAGLGAAAVQGLVALRPRAGRACCGMATGEYLFGKYNPSAIH